MYRIRYTLLFVFILAASFLVRAQIDEEAETLDSNSYDLVNPKVFSYLYETIYEEQDIPEDADEEDIQKVVEDVVAKRLRISDDQHNEYIAKISDEVRLLGLDTQGEHPEVAVWWYTYWVFFNAWEDYLEEEIIGEPLNQRAPRVDRISYNEEDQEGEEGQTSGRRGNTSAMGPGGGMGPGMGGMQGGGAQGMAGGGRSSSGNRSSRSSQSNQERKLPPVNTAAAKALIEELEASHLAQLESVMEKEYQGELNFQAKVTQDKAEKEAYENWKEAQTDQIILHLEKKLDTKFSGK